ncbi:MAG: UbiA-like polyprenyltransferase [Candidatus Latescibacterota bacterium]|nr:UbiA-like polyprenyltransferase [Candidatus Latescibacterota bacterium]
MCFIHAVGTYGRMIKFSHSVFALPFAFTGIILASIESEVSFAQIFWIIVAMVGGRSAAMGFNRLVDRFIDKANPRTSDRELPSGKVSPIAVVTFIIFSSLALIGAAWALNPLCFYLSPLVLLFLFFYSYTKRFTWGSHLILGICLGGAPLGAWLAITGYFALDPLLLFVVVMTWVAGFDVIYSCQDRDHDLHVGLYSMPSRFGISTALLIARALHVTSVITMIVVGIKVQMSWIYGLVVCMISFVLIWEHLLVGPRDLEKVGFAFLNLNAIISIAYFVGVLVDLVASNRIQQLLVY